MPILGQLPLAVAIQSSSFCWWRTVIKVCTVKALVRAQRTEATVCNYLVRKCVSPNSWVFQSDLIYSELFVQYFACSLRPSDVKPTSCRGCFLVYQDSRRWGATLGWKSVGQIVTVQNWVGHLLENLPSRAFRGPVATLVPGRNPILLHAYYPSFIGYYPHCELQTKRWFVENIGPEWVCLDIGSNIGYHTILMAECAERGFVYSFEPTRTSKMLLKNVSAAGVKNFELVPKAVGAQSGIFSEEIYRIWGQKPEKSKQVFTTIDDFVEERSPARLDLIKIDVDGFDYEALLGAKKTLDRYSPTVIIELNHALHTRGHTVADAFAFMLERKYSTVLILDKDNYVFSREWSLGEPYPQALKVTQDQRDPFESTRAEAIGDPVTDIIATGQLRNGASGRVEENVVISGPAWDYAVTFSLPGGVSPETGVVIELEVDEGDVGVFLTDSRGSNVLGQEKIARSVAGRQLFTVPIDDDSAATLVLRKTSGEDAVFRVISCNLHSLIRAETSAPVYLQAQTAEELGSLLSVTPGPTWGNYPFEAVTTCSAEELARSSGFGPNFPVMEGLGPLGGGLMEREDAALLAYLYQNLKPARHFEFGTWEGFGTTLCLKNSDAVVWTVNLPSGETQSGNPVYTQSREPNHPDNPAQNTGSTRTDSESWIGWMYRSSGLENRVHQLLADSSHLDINGLRGTFDSVLIDGSHQREVVSRDIQKALALVKPSGWLILHDFSMDPRVVRTSSSTHGVLAAVADQLGAILRDFDALWVTGTLLLLLRPKQQSEKLRASLAQS